MDRSFRLVAIDGHYGTSTIGRGHLTRDRHVPDLWRTAARKSTFVPIGTGSPKFDENASR